MADSVVGEKRAERVRMTTGEWRRAFAKLDNCPWPGPVPLSSEQTDELVGRGADIESLLIRLKDRRLIVLTGESGAGKSSFVNAGLIPTLWYNKKLPLIVNKWSGVDSTSIDGLVRSSLRAQLDAFPYRSDVGLESPVPDSVTQLAGKLLEQTGSAEGTEFWRAIDETAGSSVVLVLDQFEELIRNEGIQLLDALTMVENINRHTKLRVVISLRTEYSHQLGGLEKAADAWTLDRFLLQPIVDEASITKIVKGGNRGPFDAITADAANRLVEEWQEEVGSPSGNPGLLSLQATLYSLFHNSDRRVVRFDSVDSMIKTAAMDDDSSGVFAYGLRSAASHKLGICEAACRYDGCLDEGCERHPCEVPDHRRESIDEYLIQGTLGIVRRAVPHLSSAGYKVPIEEFDLISRALSRELEVLVGPTDAGTGIQPSELYARIRHPGSDGATVDLASLHWPKEQRLRGDRSTSGGAQRYPDYPAADDSRSVASGPMFGRGVLPVLKEELKRAAFAVMWLLEANLIRASVSGDGTTRLSLIHDGFGSALDDWSSAGRNDPHPTLMAITSSRGRVFDWSAYSGQFLGGGDNRQSRERTIANVRMTDCKILDSEFRNLVFVNCDFRGSRFEKCIFEGVAFVNCLMDGVALSECILVGDVGDVPTKDSPGRAPSFLVDTAKSEIASFYDYQGGDCVSDHGDLLNEIGGDYESCCAGENHKHRWFSDTSGFASVPEQSVSAISERPILTWVRPTGGLTMIGGRVSNLMLYRCETRGNGSAAFYHVQGAGLDIVEYGGTVDEQNADPARIVLYGAMLRGLSITRDPDERGPDGERDGNTDDPRDLELSVSESLLLNSVFGDDLTGDVSVDRCKVWNLMSVSPRDQYRVRVTDCEFWEVLNAVSIDRKSRESGAFVDGELADRESMAGLVADMSYHFQPDEWARKDEQV